jgi:threonine dehydratase
VALAASTHPGVRVVGVEAAASPAVLAAVEGRGPITVEPTLADGLAGNIEPGSVTIEMCRQYVDDIVSVSEDEIRDAMRYVAKEHGIVIEGSAGVGVAALMTGQVAASGGTTAVILTGRNIALDVYAGVLSS